MKAPNYVVTDNSRRPRSQAFGLPHINLAQLTSEQRLELWRLQQCLHIAEAVCSVRNEQYLKLSGVLGPRRELAYQRRLDAYRASNDVRRLIAKFKDSALVDALVWLPLPEQWDEYASELRPYAVQNELRARQSHFQIEQGEREGAYASYEVEEARRVWDASVAALQAINAALSEQSRDTD